MPHPLLQLLNSKSEVPELQQIRDYQSRLLEEPSAPWIPRKQRRPDFNLREFMPDQTMLPRQPDFNLREFMPDQSMPRYGGGDATIYAGGTPGFYNRGGSGFPSQGGGINYGGGYSPGFSGTLGYTGGGGGLLAGGTLDNASPQQYKPAWGTGTTTPGSGGFGF